MKHKTRAISDEQLIELFFSRSEQAIQETDAKYGGYIQSIARNFLPDESDCEECRNDTYLSLWKSIPPNRPRQLAAYIAKIIRNLALDRCKTQSRKKRIPTSHQVCIDELYPCIQGTSMEDALDQTVLQGILNRFVKDLPEREKYIFICRYYCGDSAAAISKSLGISESLVFKALASIRTRLKAVIEREGYFV